MKDRVLVNGKDDRDGLIIFRHLGDNVSPYMHSNREWQVEFHASEYDWPYPWPYGLAWVTEPYGKYRASINFVLVGDEYRGLGIATKLVRAILQRWPDAVFTDPISPGGEALVAKFTRDRKQE